MTSHVRFKYYCPVRDCSRSVAHDLPFSRMGELCVGALIESSVALIEMQRGALLARLLYLFRRNRNVPKSVRLKGRQQSIISETYFDNAVIHSTPRGGAATLGHTPRCKDSRVQQMQQALWSRRRSPSARGVGMSTLGVLFLPVSLYGRAPHQPAHISSVNLSSVSFFFLLCIFHSFL